jgi:hypothetical protein
MAQFDAEGCSEKLDVSIAETERILANRRDAGRKGGTSKSLASARQMPEQNPSQPQPQPQPQSDSDKEAPQKSSSTSPPAPPPIPVPRAREAEALAAEALAPLPTSARAHPGWRGLGAWIGRLLSDGVEGVDIVVGIAQCLRSLKDEPPSTFGYFTAAIERARDARTRPLPEPSRPKPHQLGPAGDRLRQRLGNDVFASWFGGARIVGASGDTVTIGVDTAFIRTRIISQFEAQCVAAFSAIDPTVARVEVMVAEGTR